MKPDDFDFISNMLKGRSGLVLTPDKMYLVESRLMPLARKRGLKGLDDLIAELRKPDRKLTEDVVEAMTTNESFFFRDVKPFDQFRDVVMPQMLKTRAAKKRLRIWCAAASSGQEPYTIAMVLSEMAAKLTGWTIDIVGTDIATKMLDKAKSGQYTQFEVQRGLPIQYLVKYFKKKDDIWEIEPKIRAMVNYRHWNLLDDLKGLGQFDVVFCRNVLIYFDQETKAKVLGNIAKLMPSDGVLYLGGAETVMSISEDFKPLPAHRGVYALNVDDSFAG